MLDQDKLRAVAKAVREEVVRKNEDEELGFGDYLEGMCAVASVILFQKLKDNQFDPRIAYALHNNEEEAHVFCIVDDLIVDVTATQFGFFDVEILKIGCPHSQRWFWKPVRKFATVEELVIRQKKDGWPRHQRVDEMLELV